MENLNFLLKVILLQLIAITSVLAADTNAPVVTTDVGATHTIKTIETLSWNVEDETDTEALLKAITLKDSDGNDVTGATYQWDQKCPSGYAPNPDGMCEKIGFADFIEECPLPYQLKRNDDDEPFCVTTMQQAPATGCPATYTLNGQGDACEKYEEIEASPYCSAGWELEGTTCKRILTSENTFGCDDSSFSLTANNCQKIERVPATYDCPTDWTLSGNKCQKTETKAIDTSTSADSSACPVGFTVDIPNNRCFKVLQESAIEDCEDGWWLDSSTCKKVVSKEPNLACDAGFTYQDGNCVKQTTTNAAQICPPNWTQSGTQCSISDSFDANQVCPEDYYVENKTCVQRISEQSSLCPETWTQRDSVCFSYESQPVVYDGQATSCPDGTFYKKASDGTETCEKEVTVPISAYCADGWVLEDGECTQKLFETPIFECPAEYTLSGSQCTRQLSQAITFECDAPTYLEGEKCIGTDIESVQMSCESGYVLEDKICKKTNQTATAKSCPDDWSLTGADCQLELENQIGSKDCPDGYTLKNNVCEKFESVVATDTCANGYTLKSGRCEKTTTINATKVCPSGYSLSGNSCIGVITKTAETISSWNIKYYKRVWIPPNRSNPKGKWSVSTYNLATFNASYGSSNPPSSVASYKKRECKKYGGNNGATEVCYDLFYGCPAEMACSPQSGYSFHKNAPLKGNSGNTWKYRISSSVEEDYHLTLLSSSTSCPSGWTANGPNCQKSDTKPVSYKCGTGYSLSGSQCSKLETQPSYLSCGTGWTLNTSNCERTLIINWYYGCPAGYSKSGTTCIKTDTIDAYLHCLEPAYLETNECVITSTLPMDSYCPAGYTLNGQECYKIESVPYQQICPSGFTLSGLLCVRDITASTFKECPDETWTLSGENCAKDVMRAAVYVCPTDYSETSPGLCEQRFIVALQQGDNFILDLPWLWPGDYSLNLDFSDSSNNAVSSNHLISYAPDGFDQHNGSDQLMIPSVAHSFKWPDGKETMTSSPIMVNEVQLSGTQPVWVGVHKSAIYPVEVNGVFIEPGKFAQVHDAYDFDTNKGVLSLPLQTAAEGTSGLSPVVFMVGSEGELAKIVNVDSWVFSGSINKNNDQPVQLFDSVVIEAVKGTDSCSLSASFNSSKGKPLGIDPTCFVDWDEIPSPLDRSYTGTPKLQGKLDDPFVQNVKYSAYVVDYDGTQIKVGEVSDTIEGTDPYGIISTDFNKDITALYRTVQELDTDLRIASGPSCVLTVDEEKAKEKAEKGSSVRYCYIEWTELPGNIEQKVEEPNPSLRGTIDWNGTHTLSWKIWTFNSKRMPTLLNEQSLEIVVTDPPPPEITMHPESAIDEDLGLYAVSATDSRLGDAEIISTNAYLTVKVYEDSTLIADDEYVPTPWQTKMNTYRRLEVKDKPLWTETPIQVDAIYSKLTEVKATKAITALTVPDEAIMPFINVDSTTALDTEALAVNVAIRDTYKQADGYDESTMGRWRVRVVKQTGWQQYESVSEWQEVDGTTGDADFQLDLAAIAGGEQSLRLYGEAELISAKSYYSRTEYTSKPVFMTVLIGGELSAFISTRYLSGEAPMIVRMQLKMSNYNEYRALGDVTWEISSDDGATWSTMDVAERYKTRFNHTFEEGKHLVRAHVGNKNSGVVSTTETIEIIAYRKPKIEVTGPSVVFIGDSPQYHANITFEGSPMAPEDVVIEWSEDAGKTWTLTGPDVSVTATEEKRIRLYARVRMPESPAEDLNAYSVKKLSVEFRPIKPPRVYIWGSRVVEVGAPFEFRLSTRLPYPRMSYEIDGFWTLPDGTEAVGDTVVYKPTQTDLDNEYIEMYYTAWVKDWREKGAEYKHIHKMRVWIYNWPDFTISERLTAPVAPANATLYVRPVNFVGQLDKPTYEWSIPGMANILEDRNPYARIIEMPVAGTYPISVTIRDIRGHETTVNHDIVVGEPEVMTVTLDYSTSNDFMRAPFDILVRPIVLGGHPNDRIESRTYYLNGIEIPAAGTYARATLPEGTHVVRMGVETTMGESVSGDMSLTVASNQQPTCTIEKTDKTDGWIFKANCNDVDGRVVSYRWNIDGDDIPINTYRISVSTAQYDTPDVVLEALDDSGALSDPTSLSITP